MDHEEAAAVLAYERPHDFAVGLGDVEVGDVVGWDPLELAFVEGHVGDFVVMNGAGDFEEEDEPVGLAFVGAFGDDAVHTDVVIGEADAGFFVDFTECAFVGTFAGGLIELAADG